MKGKRAQAAMEFLMTYGWAILIILVAIAALAYFGVLNPTRYVADRCVLPVPMTCGDFYVDIGQVQFRLTNGDSSTITVTRVELPQFGAGCIFNPPAPLAIASGATELITVPCVQTATADKKKSELKVSYSVGSPALNKIVTGEIYSRVN